MMDQRSESSLTGVRPELVAVVRAAYASLPRDEFSFIVTEGLRSQARQKQLFDAKLSQTMFSRHLTGHAVDLAVWVGAAISWQLQGYCRIAAAMQDAAIQLGTPVTWGACWQTINTLPHGEEAMSDAVADYSAACKAKGQRPFVDAVHFELARASFP